MYERTYWVDETDQYEDRFTETVNEDGTITHKKITGEVYIEGTPQSSKNFNNMESGIQDAHIAHALVQQAFRHLSWDHEKRIDDLEKATVQETGRIILTNSLEFPFNNSKVTVPLMNERDNLNYVVEIISASGDGNIGDIEVTGRLVNGFKISYSGSAQSVVVIYAVIGGYGDSDLDYDSQTDDESVIPAGSMATNANVNEMLADVFG